MPIKYVLIDFDGTIADTYSYYFNTLSKLYPELNIGNLTEQEISENKDKSFKTVIRENGIPFWKLLIMAYKVKSRLNKDILGIPLFPGIKELLIQLKELNVRVAVVSINNKKNILDFLKKENADNLVEDIWTTVGQFGKWRTLEKAIKKTGIKKSEVIYVGDEVRDIEACQKVGIKIAAVSWGFNSEKALRENKADYILIKPNDLLAIINL
jgi:phosphoglycolate phosphatase